MRQVLFHLPFTNLPIYGYGLMLFFAFLFCSMLAKRLCKRQGIDPLLISDLTIWLFVFGIAGGRAVYIATVWDRFPDFYWHSFTDNSLVRIISLWDGGLVLYGALIGGAGGYFAYHYFVLRKHGVSAWKMLDVVAPCIALGIGLGRIGCLFTGCCFGNVACAGCPALHFPLMTNTIPPGTTAPAGEMIKLGYQTPLGFLFKGEALEIDAVEPGSAAAAAGLRARDVIVMANGKPALAQKDVWPVAGELRLTIVRAGAEREYTFTPTSLGLHPTQPYETISMGLLLFFLLSYFPYRRRDGELLVILMLGYGVHRFLDEMLRIDVDPGLFNLGLTMSQEVSLLVLAGGAVLAVFVWRRPAIGSAAAAVGTDSAKPPA